MILLAIALGKILTTSLTIGSGGSGGVFGPSMVIGGCGGGALGLVLSHWWPGLDLNPASFVVVGMAGFFAAAAKTPFSTIVIVSEMTGGYRLLLPALWVCMLSFILSDRQSLYSAQVEKRSHSPANLCTFFRVALSGVCVRQFLQPAMTIPTLHASDPLARVLSLMRSTNLSVLPVVDGENKLVGVVNLDEVHYASQSADLQLLILTQDLMRDDVVPLQPDDPLDRAQELFIENDLVSLPVVADLAQRHLIGMVCQFRHFHRPISGDCKARRARQPGQAAPVSRFACFRP